MVVLPIRVRDLLLPDLDPQPFHLPGHQPDQFFAADAVGKAGIVLDQVRVPEQSAERAPFKDERLQTDPFQLDGGADARRSTTDDDDPPVFFIHAVFMKSHQTSRRLLPERALDKREPSGCSQ